MSNHKFFIKNKNILIPFGPHFWNIHVTLNRKRPKSRWWNNLNDDELFLLNEIYCISEARKRLFVPHYLICAPDNVESRIQNEKAILGLVYHMKYKYGGRWDILGQTKALESSLIRQGYIEEINLKDIKNICGLTEKGLKELFWFRNDLVNDKILKLFLPICVAIFLFMLGYMINHHTQQNTKTNPVPTLRH